MATLLKHLVGNISVKKGDRWVVFCLIAFATIWLGNYAHDEYGWSQKKQPEPLSDFGGYYSAALVLRSNGDRKIYAVTERPDPADPLKMVVINPLGQYPHPNSTYAVYDTVSKSQMQYIYPPFFAGVVVPLTYVEYETAKLIWHILIFLFGCGAAFLAIRMSGDDLVEALIIGTVALFALESSFPMKDLLNTGNVGSLIAFLFVLGVFFQRRYPPLSALFFAIAFMIKLTPIVVVPLFIIRRQWNWVIAFGVWCAVLMIFSITFLGLENHLEFVSRVLPAISEGHPIVNNRSIYSLITSFAYSRFLTTSEIIQGIFYDPPSLPGIIFRVFSVLSYGGILIYFWITRRTSENLRLELFTLALWSVIFSPVSWSHGYIVAFAPTLFAWLHPRTKIISVGWLSVLLTATFLMFCHSSAYLVNIFSSFHAKALAFLTLPLGAILAIIYLMVLMNRMPRSEKQVTLEPQIPSSFAANNE